MAAFVVKSESAHAIIPAVLSKATGGCSFY